MERLKCIMELFRRSVYDGGGGALSSWKLDRR